MRSELINVLFFTHACLARPVECVTIHYFYTHTVYTPMRTHKRAYRCLSGGWMPHFREFLAAALLSITLSLSLAATRGFSLPLSKPMAPLSKYFLLAWISEPCYTSGGLVAPQGIISHPLGIWPPQPRNPHIQFKDAFGLFEPFVVMSASYCKEIFKTLLTSKHKVWILLSNIAFLIQY